MLVEIPNLLTEAEVVHCRRVLESSPWVDGRVTAGQQAAKSKFNLQIPVESPQALELGDIILRALGRNPVFNSAAMPLHVLPPMFNRYDVGMKFGAHVDGAIRAIPGAGRRLRTDVSTTLFLSDPADYDGGELVIEDTYGTQEVKLPAGHAVVYPSSSLHRVNEITRGSRWGAFFWSQSMIKESERRGLLYDLDLAIIAIRTKLPDDDPAVLALTNVYHNLLRQWADM
ncbi:Fe2+-dependent dioxygenase [Xanthobacter autotrophicus]|uniref:Fe2+-dependent dioxygenase n=1 Tax=Xanthobacter autotrophicus TaxID=280 RepID=UPI0024A696DD|nr:Fe2+-dependent dioxygenase [Xanthobacter autotrophicus]MDI4655455.1 Fe2+-dependent dioxygenase [Xanthobacter autotrophicus]